MDSDAVLAANEQFYRAFNQKDFTLMEETWAANTAVTCVHPGWNVLSGREPVLEIWERILTNPDQARIVVGGAEVSFFGPVAMVICREFVAGSPLLATNLFIEEDVSWRL